MLPLQHRRQCGDCSQASNQARSRLAGLPKQEHYYLHSPVEACQEMHRQVSHQLTAHREQLGEQVHHKLLVARPVCSL